MFESLSQNFIVNVSSGKEPLDLCIHFVHFLVTVRFCWQELETQRQKLQLAAPSPPKKIWPPNKLFVLQTQKSFRANNRVFVCATLEEMWKESGN